MVHVCAGPNCRSCLTLKTSFFIVVEWLQSVLIDLQIILYFLKQFNSSNPMDFLNIIIIVF